MLIETLINRGYAIRIENGELSIANIKGELAPQDWLETKKIRILGEISTAIKTPLFLYSDYQVGKTIGQSCERLDLNFLNCEDNEDIKLFFNVDARRGKTTNKGLKGSALPKGRFKVGKRSALAKLWHQLKLEQPRKACEYHNKLHLLKPLIFTGELSEHSDKGYLKVEKKSISAACIEHPEIAKGVKLLLIAETVMHDFWRGTSIHMQDQPPSHSHYALDKKTQAINGPSAINTPESRFTVSQVCIKDILKPNPSSETTEEWLAKYENRRPMDEL